MAEPASGDKKVGAGETGKFALRQFRLQQIGVKQDAAFPSLLFKSLEFQKAFLNAEGNSSIPASWNLRQMVQA